MVPLISAAVITNPIQNAGSAKLVVAKYVPSTIFSAQFSNKLMIASTNNEPLKNSSSVAIIRAGTANATRKGGRVEKLDTNINHAIIGDSQSSIIIGGTIFSTISNGTLMFEINNPQTSTPFAILRMDITITVKSSISCIILLVTTIKHSGVILMTNRSEPGVLQMQKESIYKQVEAEIYNVTEGEDNIIANMASVSCLLNLAFEDFFWVGFYIVDKDKERELVVGPYQGTLGCLRISFDRGVCGAAAKSGKTQIVENVHDFPGHIACDSQTNSEIVVPVYNKKKELIAVFDVDSTKLSTFDKIDQFWLEKILETVFEK
jgi:L-methionine (R)-S-oxide reductase